MKGKSQQNISLQLEMNTMFQKKSVQHEHGDDIYRSDSKEKYLGNLTGKANHKETKTQDQCRDRC